MPAELLRPHEVEPLPTTVILFPGQGSQAVGMGQELCKHYPTARIIYQEADEILGVRISEISHKGPIETLTETINAQPAIFVNSHACLRILEEQGGIIHRPEFVAGHSLGEYNALVAGGAISFEEGLRLVNERAQGMQQACRENPGGMLAVISPTIEAIDHLREKFGLEVSTLNTDDQIVIGGGQEAIAEAEAWLATERISAKRLNVAGAFHTSLMKPAVGRLEKALETVDISDSQIPIIANITAKPLTNAADIKRELLDQLTNTVRWKDVIDLIAKQDIQRTLEVGEAGILTKMHNRIVGGVIVGAVATTVTGITAAILWHRHRHEPD